MIKHLLTALIPLTLAPLTAFTISLSEIQNNPQKYVKIGEDIYSAYYVDTESIKLLRDASPYYTLQADIYDVTYTSRYIFQETAVYNYDYTRSFDSIDKKLTKLFATKGTEDLLYSKAYSSALASELEKDSGIIYSNSTIDAYSFDGTYLSSLPPSTDLKADFGTQSCSYANFVFYKHFGTYFFPENFS